MPERIVSVAIRSLIAVVLQEGRQASAVVQVFSSENLDVRWRRVATEVVR